MRVEAGCGAPGLGLNQWSWGCAGCCGPPAVQGLSWDTMLHSLCTACAPLLLPHQPVRPHPAAGHAGAGLLRPRVLPAGEPRSQVRRQPAGLGVSLARCAEGPCAGQRRRWSALCLPAPEPSLSPCLQGAQDTRGAVGALPAGRRLRGAGLPVHLRNGDLSVLSLGLGSPGSVALEVPRPPASGTWSRLLGHAHRPHPATAPSVVPPSLLILSAAGTSSQL